MPSFSYRAFTQDGQSTSGTLEAASRNDAVAALQRRNLTPHQVTERSSTASPGWTYREAGKIGSELSRLTSAGVPLNIAVQLAAETQPRPFVRDQLLQISSALTAGESAKAAFAPLEGPAGRALASVVTAGERSGELANALASASPLLASIAKFRERVVSLLIYPLIVTLTALGVLAVFLLVVVPNLRPVLEDLGDDMPRATRFLLDVSDIAPNIVVGGIFIGLLFILTRQFGLFRRLYARWRDQLLLSPLGFGVSALMDAALFANILSALLQSGLSTSDAIDTAASAIGNSVTRRRMQGAASQVRKGAKLSSALATAWGETHLVTQASVLGARGGHFPHLVKEAGTVLAERAEMRLERGAAIAGPGIIIALGVLIGLFVITLFNSLMALTDAAVL